MKIPFQSYWVTSIACLTLIGAGCGGEADEIPHAEVQSQLAVNSLTVVPLLLPGQVGLRVSWTGDNPLHYYQYQIRPSGNGSWSDDYTIFEANYPQFPPTQTKWNVAIINNAPEPIDCGRSYDVRVHGSSVFATWYHATGISTPCDLGPGSLVRLRHVSDGQCLYPGLNSDMNHWGCWNDPNLLYYVEQAGAGIVRLRHAYSNRCISGSSQNGAPVLQGTCQTGSSSFRYILENAGPGLVRLRNQNSGKSLYTAGGNNGTVHSWDTWADPNMNFSLDP